MIILFTYVNFHSLLNIGFETLRIWRFPLPKQLYVHPETKPVQRA